MNTLIENWKKSLAALIAILVIIAVVWFYGASFVKCKVAGFDLDRPTDFSLITGNCMVVQADGSKVYLKRLIGTGGADVTDDADTDVIEDVAQ